MPATVRVADTLDSDAVAALLAVLAERDRRTWEHSCVTAQWAGRLAFEMRVEPERAQFIECCALLHDIGKVVTPRRILLKPGPLDDVEWTIVRDHCAVGARILERLSSLARCAPIVRAHHERFDGNGYPDRLAGLDIPFEARMIAVADAFHAMIGDRPYARAIAPRAALQTLRDGRGTQWDPDVVDAMYALVTRRTQDESESPSLAYASTA